MEQASIFKYLYYRNIVQIINPKEDTSDLNLLLNIKHEIDPYAVMFIIIIDDDNKKRYYEDNGFNPDMNDDKNDPNICLFFNSHELLNPESSSIDIIFKNSLSNINKIIYFDINDLNNFNQNILKQLLIYGKEFRITNIINIKDLKIDINISTIHIDTILFPSDLDNHWIRIIHKKFIKFYPSLEKLEEMYKEVNEIQKKSENINYLLVIKNSATYSSENNKFKHISIPFYSYVNKNNTIIINEDVIINEDNEITIYV